jgi:hypothetical protein
MATTKTVPQDTLFLNNTQQKAETTPVKKEDYSKWSVYKKLARAKVMLQKSGLKKSGYNPYDKFYYFDLGDFLPRVNEIFDELGLIGVFNIDAKTTEGVVEEIASLLIFNIDNIDEFISFTSSVFSMKNDFNKSSISIYGGKSLITEMILLFLLKFSF